MQMEGLPENNTVLIAGKIVKGCVFSHEVYGEGFYTFQISSERLSDKEDILPVTVSERLIDMNLLQVGTKVDIIGQLRSYNNYNSKKNRLVLTIFAREISLPEEEEGKNINQVYLNGFICKPPIYRKTPFGREISDILIAVMGQKCQIYRKSGGGCQYPYLGQNAKQNLSETHWRGGRRKSRL